jgi:RNA polymerase-associated protein CTR9
VAFQKINLVSVFQLQFTISVVCAVVCLQHPKYVDALLRLAAMAHARNNISTSLDLVSKALAINDKYLEGLSVRGNLELKADDWLKAKDTLKSILQITDGKDNYATLALGNWNYYAAVRGEKKDPKLEATHLEKARELYQKVCTCNCLLVLLLDV